MKYLITHMKGLQQMSRHNATQSSFRILDLVKQVTGASEEEQSMDFGIELQETGEVVDTIYNKQFNSITQWAAFSVEMENQEFEDDNCYGTLED